jgi:hypothetical protein
MFMFMRVLASAAAIAGVTPVAAVQHRRSFQDYGAVPTSGAKRPNTTVSTLADPLLAGAEEGKTGPTSPRTPTKVVIHQLCSETFRSDQGDTVIRISGGTPGSASAAAVAAADGEQHHHSAAHALLQNEEMRKALLAHPELQEYAKNKSLELVHELGEKALAKGQQLGHAFINYVDEGPAGLSHLCLLAATGTFVISVLNFINLFQALFSPFFFVVNIYILLFSAVGVIIEADPDNLAKIPVLEYGATRLGLRGGSKGSMLGAEKVFKSRLLDAWCEKACREGYKVCLFPGFCSKIFNCVHCSLVTQNGSFRRTREPVKYALSGPSEVKNWQKKLHENAKFL